jgi:hypothetical protein
MDDPNPQSRRYVALDFGRGWSTVHAPHQSAHARRSFRLGKAGRSTVCPISQGIRLGTESSFPVSKFMGLVHDTHGYLFDGIVQDHRLTWGRLS